MPLFVVLLGLLAWPFVEIAGFVVVGERIGVAGTLGLTILSSAVGLMLLRHQGLAVINRMAAGLRSGSLPPATLGHAALIALGGLLLVIPGFVSALVGLALFIPPVRSGLLWVLGRQIRVVSMSSTVRRTRDGATVVDLEDAEWRTSDGPARPVDRPRLPTPGDS